MNKERIKKYNSSNQCTLVNILFLFNNKFVSIYVRESKATERGERGASRVATRFDFRLSLQTVIGSSRISEIFDLAEPLSRYRFKNSSRVKGCRSSCARAGLEDAFSQILLSLRVDSTRDQPASTCSKTHATY